MLIILVLGLTGLAVGGVYLKRYIHRRREAREFGASGSRRDLETWAPGQSVHDIKSPGVDAPVREKGTAQDAVQNQEMPNKQRSSRRLTKFLPGRH